MRIPVMIEPTAGKGYVARACMPFGWSAEGETAEQALRNLREEAVKFVAAGGRVAEVDLLAPADPGTTPEDKGAIVAPPAGGNPWLEIAGTLDPDDPEVEEWKQAIEEYRREIDNDPDR